MSNALFTFAKDDMICETYPTGGLGCNTSLLYSQKTRETIIVDPGNDFEFLKNMIEKKSLKVLHYIHTHAHFDHIGRTPDLMAYMPAQCWLHRKDFFLYEALPLQARYFGATAANPIPLEDDLKDDQEFSLGSLSLLKTIHTPGHTPGSCSFFSEVFDGPLCFSGDTLFKQSIGRTDLPGGDSQLITKSIRGRLYSLPDETICIPGHGPLTLLHEEKRFNPYVRA